MVHDLDFMGYPAYGGDIQSLTERLTGRGRAHGRFHLVNAYNVVLADANPTLRQIYASAANVVLDGSSTVLAARILSRTPAHHVRGPDLFRHCLDAGRATDIRHFLLGGSPTTARMLQERISEQYPGCRVVGMLAPPHKDFDAADIAEMQSAISASAPHMVWVGLGTPKQDLVAAALDDSAVAILTVGAAFDFLAGIKKEAPGWAVRLHVEWLHRLSTEPRRLWRRYAHSLPVFAFMVIRAFVGQRLGRLKEGRAGRVDAGSRTEQ